jgi:hypothetical protein
VHTEVNSKLGGTVANSGGTITGGNIGKGVRGNGGNGTGGGGGGGGGGGSGITAHSMMEVSIIKSYEL